jgi:hypothetical protein
MDKPLNMKTNKNNLKAFTTQSCKEPIKEAKVKTVAKAKVKDINNNKVMLVQAPMKLTEHD